MFSFSYYDFIKRVIIKSNLSIIFSQNKDNLAYSEWQIEE